MFYSRNAAGSEVGVGEKEKEKEMWRGGGGWAVQGQLVHHPRFTVEMQPVNTVSLELFIWRDSNSVLLLGVSHCL